MLPNNRFTTAVRWSGFTLVELAIVLVIIGLIVGAVLAGKDLVRGAQIRAQMKQVEDIKSAALAFKLKYGCLPGDCANATSFLTGASQPDKVTNGNGNGLIDRGDCTNRCSYTWQWGGLEWKYVFDHLAAAGMFNFATYDETLAGNSNNRAGYGYPACAMAPEGLWNAGQPGSPGTFDCGVILSYEFNGHYVRIGAAPLYSSISYLNFNAGLIPSVAQQMDEKFDDGKPASGTFQMGGVPDRSGRHYRYYRQRGQWHGWREQPMHQCGDDGV